MSVRKIFLYVFLTLFPALLIAGGRPLEFTDLMKFRTVHDTVVSKDGQWIAYALQVDRGDGEAFVRSTRGETEHHIERGASPRISGDGRWVAAKIEPTLEESEKESQDKEDPPKTGMALLDLSDGTEVRVERVESFAFSEDGRFLAYKLFAEKEEKEKDEAEPEEGETEEKAEDDKDDKDKKEDLGTELILRRLGTGEETHLEHVTAYAFDEASTALAYTVSAPKGEGNGAYLRRLGGDGQVETLSQMEKGRYTQLAWAKEVSRLAFLEAPVEDDEPGDAKLHVWDEEGGRIAARREDAPEGFTIPSKNELVWSRDGKRLFFGFQPVKEKEEDEKADTEDEEKPFDPYDVEAILEKRGVDVWHWNDPKIIPEQKKEWEKEKDRTYRAVFHLGSGKVTALADLEMRDVAPSENPRSVLAMADVPYLKELTWDGPFRDVYLVDVTSGERRLVTKHLRDSYLGGGSVTLSPAGRYVVYYQDGDWHLFDADDGSTKNLTASLGVPFANEDHDYPQPPPGYGMAEWIADESGVLIYDKYDVWQFGVDGSEPLRLTAGREKELIFRVIDLDPEEEALEPGARLLLVAYHDKEKHDAFFAGQLGKAGTEKLYGDGGHRLGFLAKAEEADQIVFTRESYNEFPDLWVSGLDVQAPRKLTTVNPQIQDFAWGSAELVEWSSADGIPLQGVLIKPGNYEPGKRYPVLVYFYRFFSQRLHEFNEPVVNHRPSFPVYASHGYAVFLPDVRFEIGRPGFSATKCLVPGVQKLIDMGVADPDAIALHGHSWSGYQTAFVVTQTNIFKAAIAGAPVSNMTSAYSGIRWESGLARQFQYERSQSRLGASLWEARDRYIDNSPVFFADRIETPLLIMFGDEDGAVPWYQGIELYLALRRLGKDAIFLEYRGEGHHPKKYANKLDYSIRMKEFLDHHLKGAPAPEWMTEGVPYRGK